MTNVRVQEEHQRVVTDSEFDITATHADTQVRSDHLETILRTVISRNLIGETSLICLQSEHNLGSSAAFVGPISVLQTH